MGIKIYPIVKHEEDMIAKEFPPSETVDAMRTDASKRFWLWQGEDIEQAKRIFRLRFGKEPGRHWLPGQMKGVLEGHILFALDMGAIIEPEE